jgi:diguanylate cyclase (GGDEF)-like protein/PAS domain S-box-containing protein
MIEDISERKAAEAKILKLSQLYLTLSRCNAEIVQSKSEDEMFAAVCRVIVELGGLAMACVGLADRETGMVRVAASFGAGVAYLQELQISLDGNDPRGRGPFGIAIREDRAVWCQDFGNDPRTAPWHELGARFGWGGAAALPLRQVGQTVGALTLYMTETSAFDEETRDLLIEIATVVSFGLDNFVNEAAQRIAEQNLRDSEERYRLLFENSSDAILVTVPDGQILSANSAASRMFGCSDADLKAIGRDRLIDSADSSVEHVVAESMRTGTFNGNLTMMRYSGEKFSAEISTALFNERGGQTCVSIIIRDITEREQMYEKLQEREAELRKTERLAGLGSWLLDIKSGSVRWSIETFAIFGRDPKLGVPPFSEHWKFMTSESFVEMEGAIRKTIEQGEPYEIELEVIRPDQSRGWVLARGEAVENATDCITVVRGTVLDITKRKYSELALRENEEKLRQILEHSTQLFYSRSVDGQFIYVSPNIEKFLEFTVTDALPKWADFLTDNAINEQGLEATRRAIESGETQRPYQLELKSRLGRIVWVEVYESPVVVHGRTAAIVGALTDITERKNEEARQRAQEERHLRQRNALIEFTGSDVPDEELIDTVRRIMEIDARTLEVARVSVWRYNQNRTAIQCMDLYELEADRHTAGMELAAAVNPVYFSALAEVDVIASEDAQHDARTCEFAEHYLRPMGITSMLDVPIHLGGTGVGVLCHEHIGPQRQWAADEESFAVAVANLVSLALERLERKRSEIAIEQAMQRLNEAQRIGQIGDWEYHIATQKIAWSPQVFKILGRDPAFGPPRNFEENAVMYDVASRVLMEEKINRAIACGEAQEYELLAERPDGEKVHIQAVAVPRKDESGKVIGLHGTVQDISARKRAELALFSRAYQQVLVATLGRFALADENLNHVFTEAASAVAKGLDVKYSKVILLNTGAGVFTLEAGVGWQPGWVGRHHIGDITEYSQTGCVVASREPVIVDDFSKETRFTPSEMLLKHGIVSGIYVPIGDAERPLGVLGAYAHEKRKFSTDDIGFLQSLSNTLSTAIERTHVHERLAYIAQHDALTDLPNRLLLTDRLNVALAQARRAGKGLALIFIDLDRFKNVNDAFGHEMGDKVLREVAAKITNCVREIDTVSRQGGDEFLVILPEIDTKKDAARVAQKLIATLVTPISLDGTEVVLGGSIGIACFPESGRDARTLLRNADAAMYVAKEKGRNCYQFYSAEMNARALERLTLAGDLRRAIEREQLFVAYQPQIDLSSGAIVGLEALVRWRHPKLGLVPPGQFIPIAEENGLIEPIGAWVLETACRQYAGWLAEGLTAGTIAVNVSARQFRQSNFVDSVSAALVRSGLLASYLELEVTEGVVMQGIDEVLDKLGSLDRLGVKLAIDDFGTGYSSLSYLKQFPIYRLKIDQSFICGLPNDHESSAIVKAVISLGHSLGLNVLGEGIETKAQEEYLRSLSCDAGQGFLYSKPIAADECTEYLRLNAHSLIVPCPYP